MLTENLINAVVMSLVFSFIGVLVLLLCFWIVEKITPENLWKEILVNKNKALAIMAAGFMISIAIIISAAING
jgi:putative membrane protein